MSQHDLIICNLGLFGIGIALLVIFCFWSGVRISEKIDSKEERNDHEQ